MIVVDSSALVAILLREPDHLVFAAAIARAERVVIAMPNALELIMVSVGKLGEQGRQKAESLLADANIEIMGATPEHFGLSVDAFMKFGRGRNHPAKLNFGDCMAYALAKSLNAPLLYKGDDFEQTDIRSAL